MLGNTALHMAAIVADSEIAEVLINANPKAESIQNMDGRTASALGFLKWGDIAVEKMRKNSGRLDASKSYNP